MEIRWAEPPEGYLERKRARAESIYKHLASRPGQHAIIGTYPRRESADVRLSNIKRGKVKSARDLGMFDGFVHRNDQGQYDLYLRMVP